MASLDDVPDLLAGLIPSPVPDSAPGDLLGPNNELLATTLAEVFSAAGGNLPGIEVFVFPISGTDSQMLVLDYADTGALAVEDVDDATQSALQTMLLAPEIAEWNITRITMNLRTTDAEGPAIITMTAELDQAKIQAGESIVDGALVEIQRP